MMEHPQYYAPHRIVDSSSSSRPSLGFPLGTAFLLIAVFSLSGIFSCCYHWNSLRRATDLEAGHDPASVKSELTYMSHEKLNQRPSMSAVLMPGDQVPKFIALPCPCQSLRLEKVVEEVQEQQPPPPPPPPKQIRMVVGLPL